MTTLDEIEKLATIARVKRSKRFRGDSEGNPSQSVNTSLMAAIRRAWAEGADEYENPYEISPAEIIAVERRVSAALYPKEQ